MQQLLPCLSHTLEWAVDDPFLHLSSQTQCKGWESVSGDILSTGPLMPLACCPGQVNGQDKCMPKRGSDGSEYRTFTQSIMNSFFFFKDKKIPLIAETKKLLVEKMWVHTCWPKCKGWQVCGHIVQSQQNWDISVWLISAPALDVPQKRLRRQCTQRVLSLLSVWIYKSLRLSVHFRFLYLKD